MRGIAAGNIIAADILSAVGNFQSASAINVALGKPLIPQITGRIARQDAVALAYTFQLILQTLPSVKVELQDSGYIKYWKEETKRILSGPSDLDEVTDPSLPIHWLRSSPSARPRSARNSLARSISSATSAQEWPHSPGGQFARLNSIRPATTSPGLR
jgi:hypothetical protein